MIVTRQLLPPVPDALHPGIEVFVVRCEGCEFSSMSHSEHDAVAIVERHQAKCPKFQAAKASGKITEAITRAS
jgi:hypothetical protein